ncbi:MAG: zinc-dependent metalloprotease [Flavobacteriaceae bacterium]|nr:zinc-dependent metalloprotease [Flavobacteriaceae bacterium]
MKAIKRNLCDRNGMGCAPAKATFLLLFLGFFTACSLKGQAKPWDIREDGNRLLLRMDESLLEKPMLHVRHGREGVHIGWKRRGNTLIMQAIPIRSLTGVVIPTQSKSGVVPQVLGTFPILDASGQGERVAIDISGFLLSGQSYLKKFGNEDVIRGRSYVDRFSASKDEILIHAQLMVREGGKEMTKKVGFSFFILPEPMRPRLYDKRMGFHYDDHWGRTISGKASIVRWRLKKKYPDRTLSDPVDPIVFYLDPKMPDRWKPYVTAGIMEWLPAFETAGFTNAVEVREFDGGMEYQDPVGIKYSMIQWNNHIGVRGKKFQSGSTIKLVIDQRSGEILKCDIIINSFLSLFEAYYVRCAPLDTRTRQKVVPDELMGELLKSLTAHEAGHAFGLRDANYGEYTYPFEKMRDLAWLKQMGHTPSVMTYARQNYLVQPTDGIPPKWLHQKVGPTDRYHIEWGYREFLEAKTPEAELPYLERLIRQQDTVPWYRYTLGGDEIFGPGETNEVVENDNPVASTRLGLQNIRRVLDILNEDKDVILDQETIERRYENVLDLWYRQMQHVMSLVGGYEELNHLDPKGGNVYRTIPLETQEDALGYLLDNVFSPPEWLVNPKCLEGMHYSTNQDLIVDYQKRLLEELLAPRRMKRLEKLEEILGNGNIVESVLDQIQKDMFSDESVGDRNRQHLQKLYIKTLKKALEVKEQDSRYKQYYYSESTKIVFASKSYQLQQMLNYKLSKTKDENIWIHLKLCLMELQVLQ